MTALTAEQRALVASHVAFARWAVRRYFPHLIGDVDVYQAACLGVCVAARRFDPSRGTFRTYAAHWCRASVQAQQGRRDPRPEVTGFDFGPMAARGEDLDKRADAADALAAARPAERDVLSLLYLEGLTAKETGERLGMSADRVQTVKQTAIRRIRRALPDLAVT